MAGVKEILFKREDNRVNECSLCGTGLKLLFGSDQRIEVAWMRCLDLKGDYVKDKYDLSRKIRYFPALHELFK